MSLAEQKSEKPHYHGHRDRLRARFIDSGADALQNYELLELILFSCIPRRDVKPLAKAILAEFKTLSGVLNAPLNQLTRFNGISENTAVHIKTMHAVMMRGMKQGLKNKPLLNNWERLVEYCQATLGHEIREHFHVIFLNKKNEILADERQGSGTVDHTPAYPREIIKRALELGATSLVLMHNHPSGNIEPSRDDIDLTYAVVHAGKTFNIAVHDHLIVTSNNYYSFKNNNII